MAVLCERMKADVAIPGGVHKVEDVIQSLVDGAKVAILKCLACSIGRFGLGQNTRPLITSRSQSNWFAMTRAWVRRGLGLQRFSKVGRWGRCPTVPLRFALPALLHHQETGRSADLVLLPPQQTA